MPATIVNEAEIVPSPATVISAPVAVLKILRCRTPGRPGSRVPGGSLSVGRCRCCKRECCRVSQRSNPIR